MKLIQNYSRGSQLIFDYKDRPFIKNTYEQLRYAILHKATWKLLNEEEIEPLSPEDNKRKYL